MAPTDPGQIDNKVMALKILKGNPQHEDVRLPLGESFCPFALFIGFHMWVRPESDGKAGGTPETEWHSLFRVSVEQKRVVGT